MRKDLVGNIKNAFERGQTIEQAIKSLINAGYNSDEVMEAADYFHDNISMLPNQSEKENEPKNEQKKTNIFPTIDNNISQEKKPKLNKTWILIGILVFLLIVLGLTIIFMDKIF